MPGTDESLFISHNDSSGHIVPSQLHFTDKETEANKIDRILLRAAEPLTSRAKVQGSSASRVHASP